MDPFTAPILRVLADGRALVCADVGDLLDTLHEGAPKQIWTLYPLRECVFAEMRAWPRRAMRFELADVGAPVLARGEWCFVPTDNTYREFMLGWNVGQSAQEPHKNWFAFARPEELERGLRGDLSQRLRLVDKRLAYQCVRLRTIESYERKTVRTLVACGEEECDRIRQLLEFFVDGARERDHDAPIARFVSHP